MQITQTQIDEIFDKAENQTEAWIEVYKLVYPDWDDIKHIQGFPKASTKLWHYICNKFLVLDAEKHPGVMAGGLWMNRGFGEDKDLKDWEVTPAPAEY